jgi:pSer/pThr/pTyr-binding forkhead associated (FHA) protein
MSERTAARLGSSDRTQDLPVLIAQTGKLNGSRWVLEGAQTLIGRGAECGLVIPDRQVSRVHARIVHSPEAYGGRGARTAPMSTVRLWRRCCCRTETSSRWRWR